MTDLTGKVALITGSARGIGKAIAIRYAGCGASVVVNYPSDAAEAERTAAEIRELGGSVLTVRADVSKVPEIEELFRAALDRFGRIDIVVANAGLEVLSEPVSDATEEQFDRLFAVNTKGTFFTLQNAAKYVAEHGRIIYIGSSTTAGPLPGTGLYGASKIAARLLAGTLALELASRGIAVNTILPTTVEGAGVFTDLAADHPVREQLSALRRGVRMARPEDVADAAEYFAGELSSFVSGQSLLLTGGATF
ncbi:SDR family oxidoreductase [Amycolatopsis ultiminotia]|uniref:SDR family oxidoreductase n=1 Tax=Amycolatopsis ultiminotia TaxID=543629 RepID=A0ABP6X3J2_9PSEU